MPEPLYEFIFRSSSDGMLIADSDGIIEQMNPAAASLLAMTVEQVLGKTAEQLFIQNPPLFNLFSRSGNQSLEVRLPRKRLAVGIAETLPDGKHAILLHDVTEKQELESRRETLIHAISHDLRNPISALSGYADLIDKFGEMNEQQQKFLTRIKQTSSKLYEVVGSMVDLAWIEAGMPLAYRPIDMSALINEAVQQLTHFAMERHITIAVSVQDPLPALMGDPERIQAAILNVLHNAILYSEPEHPVAIHAWGDANEAYCSVADRGIGIVEEELSFIFDRMYRSKDERVRDIPGGGVGLTMTRTIIRRHGGDIWVSSNLGVGSTFTFVLPGLK